MIHTMNSPLLSALVLLALSANVAADPVRCVVDGKTIYTDDAKNCGKNAAKPLDSNNTVSTFPKVETHANSKPTVTPSSNSVPGGAPGAVLQNLGVSEQELTSGWQTIMDAQKRGTWALPKEPNP